MFLAQKPKWVLPEQPHRPSTAATKQNADHYHFELVEESDHEEDQALPPPVLAPD